MNSSWFEIRELVRGVDSSWFEIRELFRGVDSRLFEIISRLYCWRLNSYQKSGQ